MQTNCMSCNQKQGLQSFDWCNSCSYKIPSKKWDCQPCREQKEMQSYPGYVTVLDLDQTFSDNQIILTLRNCSSSHLKMWIVKDCGQKIEICIAPYMCLTKTFTDVQKIVLENDTCTVAQVEVDYRLHYNFKVNCGCVEY